MDVVFTECAAGCCATAPHFSHFLSALLPALPTKLGADVDARSPSVAFKTVAACASKWLTSAGRSLKSIVLLFWPMLPYISIYCAAQAAAAVGM